MKKFLVVVKKEFFKNIKKPWFWILTFWLPLLYIIIFWVTFYSSKETEEILNKKNEIIKNIYIYDESWLIKDINNEKKIVFVKDYNNWYNSFLWKEENIFIYYKKDFLTTKKIDLFVNSKESLDSYNKIVDNITKTSIFNKIEQKDLAESYASNFLTNVKKFQNSKEVLDLWNKAIISWIWAMLFFFMMIFWNTLMLTSLSQEKENRTIEIILSTIKTSTFINWKIFWWLCILIFQLFIFLLFPIITILLFKEKIPSFIFDILKTITFLDWFSMIFYIVWWFLIFSWFMVAAWSLWANSKQAANLSSPFIIISCLPLYLATSLISNPQWTLSMFFSYFPFTSPMLLLYRTWAWELYQIEKFLWPIVIIIYILISFFIAKKVFEASALEYNRKISLKSIFIKSKKS